MSETYYRVQTADRAPADLLDPGYQYSHAWNGSHTREGVSVCDSVDDLALYLASAQGDAIGRAVRDGNWVIVELRADRIPGAAPVDPELESLVRPTAILSVRPVDDGFLAMVDAADQMLASYCTSDWDEE